MSLKTETEALNILKDKNALSDLMIIDKSDNQILLTSLAYFYNLGISLSNLKQVFSKIPDLLKSKVLTIQYTRNGIKVNSDLISDWIKFSEKIDALASAIEYKKLQKLNIKSIEDINDIDTPIWEGNGIKIFDGSDVGKCIRLGKGQSFCISQPANTQYQSYRDTKTSTFYFIYDSNQKNPLKTVVFDNTKYGVELTDETNNTGIIFKYEDNVKEYIKYLKSKGVPVDSILLNKPHTKEELDENKLIGNENTDLKWFIDLTPELKSKYIGRGHKLSNEQFKYLMNNKLYDLLNQYVNIGNDLNNYQFKLIETLPNILKSYIRTCYQKLTRIDYYNLKFNIIKYLYKFGYLDSDKTYPNGKSDGYYKCIINPTIDLIKKYNIDLETCCYYGYCDIVKILIDNGADVHMQDNYPIRFASDNGHYDIVKLLIENGADVSSKNNYAIRLASRNGHYDIVELLIENGADVTDNDNYSIIDASKNGHYDIVELLIENGADVTANDNYPIKIASENGYYDIVKLLIDNGADVQTQNNYPIRIASENGHYDIIKLLKQHGTIL